MAALTIGGHSFTLIRSQRKSVAVEITHGGQLLIRAPMRMSEAFIRAFVLSKLPWIEEKLAKRASTPSLRFENGAPFPLQGEMKTLRFADVKCVTVSGTELLLPRNAERKTLDAFLKKKAKQTLFPRLRQLAQVMGEDRKISDIRLSSAKKRWGSCSASNSINLNWRLILLPAQAADLVIVHELCHIRHKNHSRDFYLALEAVLADWKEREKLLKDWSWVMDEE